MFVFEPVEVEDCPVELEFVLELPVVGNIEPMPPKTVPNPERSTP